MGGFDDGLEGRLDVDTNAVRRSVGVPLEGRKGVEDVKAVEDMIAVKRGRLVVERVLTDSKRGLPFSELKRNNFLGQS